VQNDSAIYIVMELVRGGDLFDRIIARHCYPEPDARSLMLRLLSGVAYLHRNGIVHRDLKPENILLTSATDHVACKITDFGLAKQQAKEGEEGGAGGGGKGGGDGGYGDSGGLAELGGSMQCKTFCGTPQYFAPEVLQRKDTVLQQGTYGKSADMWSLGVILYILLSGCPPFNSSTLFEQISKAAFHFLPEQWAHISDAAKDVVTGLLTAQPHRRLTVQQALDHEWATGAPFDKAAAAAATQKRHAAADEKWRAQVQRQQRAQAVARGAAVGAEPAGAPPPPPAAGSGAGKTTPRSPLMLPPSSEPPQQKRKRGAPASGARASARPHARARPNSKAAKAAAAAKNKPALQLMAVKSPARPPPAGAAADGSGGGLDDDPIEEDDSQSGATKEEAASAAASSSSSSSSSSAPSPSAAAAPTVAAAAAASAAAAGISEPASMAPAALAVAAVLPPPPPPPARLGAAGQRNKSLETPLQTAPKPNFFKTSPSAMPKGRPNFVAPSVPARSGATAVAATEKGGAAKKATAAAAAPGAAASLNRRTLSSYGFGKAAAAKQ